MLPQLPVDQAHAGTFISNQRCRRARRPFGRGGRSCRWRCATKGMWRAKYERFLGNAFLCLAIDQFELIDAFRPYPCISLRHLFPAQG